VIVIAHRLATIRNCDCIHVLHKGKLLETGTHDQLIQQNGAYVRLWQP
jgi:ABC-type multidrug transport system fused ATPase/permease subunit